MGKATDSTPDRIVIRDLVVTCIVGTKPYERIHPQPVCINLVLECDLRLAGRTDALADTINYKHLKDAVVERVRHSRFFLVERMAQVIAELCLADRRVRAVTVSVDKPTALTGARTVGVEIRRVRASTIRRKGRG